MELPSALMTLNHDCFTYLTTLIIKDYARTISLNWSSLNRFFKELYESSIKVYYGSIHFMGKPPPKTLCYQENGEGLLICFQLKERNPIPFNKDTKPEIGCVITTSKESNRWVTLMTLSIKRGPVELVYEGSKYYFNINKADKMIHSLEKYMG